MGTDLMAQRPQTQISRIKHLHRGRRGGASVYDNQLIIKLPHWRVWLVLVRLAVLAAAIFIFPCARSIVRSPKPYLHHAVPSESIDDSFYLRMLFDDLSEVGLLRSGDRVLLVGDAGRRCEQMLKEKMDLDSVVLDHELHGSNAPQNETLDFAFADGFSSAEFMSRALKTGGIMAIRMNGDPLSTFWVPMNFKIVYIRQLDATVIAMRKMDSAAEATLQPSSNRRRLCGADLDGNRAKLLSELEDLPLEPLRANSTESGAYADGTRYLPDLTGDPLDAYPRRVFVEVGPAASDGAGWFEQHYPKRDQVFDAYLVEITEKGVSAASIGMSEWLAMNVREEEYVVMKADADAVEELMKSRAICLVDELFMECNQQEQGEEGMRRKRAYWECLAILGKLRREGIAVHQWWA